MKADTRVIDTRLPRELMRIICLVKLVDEMTVNMRQEEEEEEEDKEVSDRLVHVTQATKVTVRRVKEKVCGNLISGAS